MLLRNTCPPPSNQPLRHLHYFLSHLGAAADAGVEVRRQLAQQPASLVLPAVVAQPLGELGEAQAAAADGPHPHVQGRLRGQELPVLDVAPAGMTKVGGWRR